MVIALTHMRVNNDQLMIQNCTTVDLFLGGHDHIVYYEKHKNNVTIKSGCDFKNFSVIHLEKCGTELPKLENALVEDKSMIDQDVKPGVEYSAIVGVKEKYLLKSTLIEVGKDMPVDPVIEKHTNDSYMEFDEKMKRPVCFLDAEIDSRFTKVRAEETPIGNFITDLMRKEHNADCAVLNSGNIRADRVFEKGATMLLGDWYEMIPFTVPICLLKLTGQQILTMLETSVSMLPSLSGRFLQVSYISFSFDISKPAGQRVVQDSVMIGGKPVEKEKKYTVAAPDFLVAGKDGYEDVLNAQVVVTDENGPELKLILTKFFEDSYSNSPDSEVNLFRENQKMFSQEVLRSKIGTKLDTHRDRIKKSMAAIRSLIVNFRQACTDFRRRVAPQIVTDNCSSSHRNHQRARSTTWQHCRNQRPRNR